MAFYNITFVNGKSNDGGAICWLGSSEGVVSGCSFVNNVGEGVGGAVCWYGSGFVSDCSFISNKADKGGAIFWNGGGDVVSGCSFIGNNADSGGAIFWDVVCGNVYDCSFVSNNAGRYGSAIYWNLVGGVVSRSSFIGNQCHDPDSGVIHADYYTDANYCWFGNSATNYNDSLPTWGDVNCTYRLFLNTTVNLTDMYLFETSDIVFKLCLYNSTSGIISDYDNALFGYLNLTIAPTNGNVDKSIAKLGDTITYAGNAAGLDNIAASIENNIVSIVSIDVHKFNSTLMINDNVNFDYGAIGSTTVSFTNASGVKASVIGQPKAVVSVNDNVITVSGLNAGTYTLSVTTITDENHDPVTKNAAITVNKLKAEFSAHAISTTYNINRNLVITLKDLTGKALSGVSVTVDLGGVRQYVTDGNGQVKVSTYRLIPKKYVARITLTDIANYEGSSANVKVVVKKATPKIVAKKKTYKAKAKTKKFTITLKGNTRKPIKNAKVMLIVKLTKKIKFKMKKNRVKTNKKGKATFKIDISKKGKYSAVVKFAGNKCYKAVTKKVKITIK